MTFEAEGQTYLPMKTWWDCVEDDKESLGLYQNDA